MPYGIAVRQGSPQDSAFHPFSVMFKLWPSLGNDEANGGHVVVAFSPAASDHGMPETTVFKTDAAGNPRPYGGVDGGAEALSPSRRIIGRWDPEAALANLASSGYVEVALEDFDALRAEGLHRAEAFAKSTLRMSASDAQGYAGNNWGFFAAQAAVLSDRNLLPVQSVNHLQWS